MNVQTSTVFPVQQAGYQPVYQQQPPVYQQTGFQAGVQMGPSVGMVDPGTGMVITNVMPQQFVIVNQQPPIVSGYEKLGQQPGVFIRQKFLLLEALTGCEQENKYNIFQLNQDGESKRGPSIFKVKERSGFCARQCCHPSCRPFKMDINHEDVREDVDNPFLKLDRPCSCTFLCCNRPYMETFFVETINGQSNNAKLGTIRAPWTCYDHQIDVHDGTDSLKYKVVANCCQLGFHCKWPCDPCQQIHFDIRNSGGDDIATLEKFSQGCIKASVEESSNFILNFPPNIPPEDKALLIAATLMIDFRFFLEKPDNNRDA